MSRRGENIDHEARNHRSAIQVVVAITMIAIAIATPVASAAAPLVFSNSTQGDVYEYSWNGTYNFSHAVQWTFTVNLTDDLPDPPIIVSVPFEFTPTPLNSQVGPTVNNSVFFNGILAEHSTTSDTAGAGFGNINGFEWDLYANTPGQRVNTTGLHPGTNTILVVSDLTFTDAHRPGSINVTLGPIRVTTIGYAMRATPGLAPFIVVAVLFAAARVKRHKEIGS